MNAYKNNQFLNERLYSKLLPSGLNCYIIPKKGYVENQAVLCVRYGSIDNSFAVGGEKHEMPAGIAHFIEHKMFEDEEINVFAEFSKLGAEVNAFTSFTTTAYYFSCGENFDKCLPLLLEFVGKPYFTDENVESEKGIIEQEINMCADDPNWAVYFQMLGCLYHRHPIKENIAGTAKSIKKITKGMLYECYESFYQPRNMALVCVGDLEPEEIAARVEDITDKGWRTGSRGKEAACGENHEIIRDYKIEPPEIKGNFESKNMGLAVPKFCAGFKENRFDVDIPLKTASTKLLLDIIAGESGELYGELYDSGLIDDSFSFDYNCGADFGHSVFSGASRKPEAVFEKITEYIDLLRKTGIDEGRFERIKKKHIGRFARGFGYLDAIASSQADYFTKGTDILDMFSAYEKVTLKDVSERLYNHLNLSAAAVSVVK